MIKHTCVRPYERFQSIDRSIKNVFCHGKDENLNSINMNVDSKMMVVEGKGLSFISCFILKSI